MELKNKLKILIIEKGYRSIMQFCEQHNMDYRKINRLANNEANSFHIKTVVEVCEALDCEIGDLFYLEHGQAS